MTRLTKAKALPGHRLSLVFSDGATGTLDCASWLTNTGMDELSAPGVWSKAELAKGGRTLFWPGTRHAVSAEVLRAEI